MTLHGRWPGGPTKIPEAAMGISSSGIRILIADDNSLFREGLRTLLEEQPGFSVVGEAVDGKDALQFIDQAKPGILLLGVEVPDAAAIKILRSIRGADGELRIVLLAADIKPNQAAEAFKSGVHGLILKESAAQLLFKCINSIMDGRYWIPGKGVSDTPQLEDNDKMPKPAKGAPQQYDLTSREMQILAAVVAGRTNREIAKRFSISEQTVKHHVTNIFDKVGVYNRLELALFAIHHGLIANKPK
jgi:two-component system, NarL family, nitrate/nitrite response regulator NarL